MNKELKIKYAAIALAEQQLRNLSSSISDEFNVDIANSQGEFSDELRKTVKDLNEFRVALIDVIDKTAKALNNTIVSFKKADENISYRG